MEQLSYNEFYDKLEEALKQLFPSASTERTTFAKTDECERDTLVLGFTDIEGFERCGLKIYPEESFDYYQKGADFGEIVLSIFRSLESSLEPSMIQAIRNAAPGLEDYEKAKPRLFIRAQSYPRNKEQLKPMVFRKKGDVALVLYYLTSLDPGGMSSVRVEAAKLEQWGQKPEGVLDYALMNTESLFPPRILSFNWAMKNGVDSEGPEFDFTRPGFRLPPDRLYILKNNRSSNGATVVFYPDVPARVAALLKDDVFFVFTSTHEAMVHPARTADVSDLKSIAAGNTDAPLDDVRDFLSIGVFRYFRKDKTLRML